MTRHLFISVLLLLSTLFTTHASAVLNFSVQPNPHISADDPLLPEIAKQIEGIMGEDVNYIPFKRMGRFNRALLQLELDIVLVEPHIAAWLLKDASTADLAHNLMLGSKASMQYAVIAPEDSFIDDLSDLNGNFVCSEPSPNLSAVAFLNMSNDPVNPPTIVAIKDRESALKRLKKKQCSAIIVDKKDMSFWREQLGEIKTIVESPVFPGWAMTISIIQPQSIVEKVRANIISSDTENNSVDRFFQHIEKTDSPQYFESSDRSHYKPFNILPGVVWGW